MNSLRSIQQGGKTPRTMRAYPYRGAVFSAIFFFMAGLCGCPNPNLYSTPRTVSPGRFAHTVALEGFGYSGDKQIADDPNTSANEARTVRSTGYLPSLPSYLFRYGLLDSVDIGLHLHNVSSLGFDIKWNPLRGVFDLAVDPAFQYFTIAGTTNEKQNIMGHVFYFHAPVLLGINPSEWFSIVLTPGISYGLKSGQLVGEDTASTTLGAMFRGGLGFQFRIWENFAVHPEVSVLKSLEGPALSFSTGIGFHFGSIPGFEDRAPPKPAPRPEANETDKKR